ncbi:hypothetical protein ACHAQA_007788 [Verticillium albo-atrum]
MPDTATPEIQATAADLSPLSPNPVHAVAPIILPALQDTADILDAMTEMPSVQEIKDAGLSLVPDASPAPPADGQTDPQNDDNLDSDLDSLDEAYNGEEEEPSRDTDQKEQEKPDAVEDDYLKSFDSPIQDELDTSAGQDHVSQAADSHSNHLSFDPPQSAQVVPDVDSSAQQTPAAQPAHQPTADHTSHGHSDSANGDAQAIDISRLVAEMTAQAEEHPGEQPPQPNAHSRPSQDVPPLASSSLPPKPPVTEGAAAALTNPDDIHLLHQPHGVPGQTPHYAAAAAHGSFAGAPPFQAPVAPTSMNAPPYHDSADFAAHQSSDTTDPNSLWEAFNADERRYMAEARWDKFPEGSRIFIGNLSSERVSKRDVFNIFREYGPLAQISLKSAYGFVQYHTVEDAQGAMQNLQGSEVKGRKIRGHVVAGENRGREVATDKTTDEDAKNAAQVELRPREGVETTGTGVIGVIKSLPTRHAVVLVRHPAMRDLTTLTVVIPDVQFLLLQEVNPDFVDWASRAFVDRGLKIDVMFLHPNMPRDAVIQRQVVEGVHAVVDLDIRANTTGRFSVRVFDRSQGGNTRFDEYQELEPHVAAELVVRARALTAAPPSYHAQPPAPVPRNNRLCSSTQPHMVATQATLILPQVRRKVRDPE